MTRLIRAELLKMRTTKTWWLFGSGVLVFTALALLFNCVQTHVALTRPAPGQSVDAAAQAAAIYTSGQFFGALLIMLLGMLVVTSEYFHQTATTTFLATPRRTRVILSKFLATIAASIAFWALALVPSLVTGVLYLRYEGLGTSLGDRQVWRSILLALAVYVVWAVFGVGLGVLIRSQVGAMITGTVLYLIGTQAAQIVFYLIYTFWIKKEWVMTALVVVPSIASLVMTSATKLYPQSPPAWVGAAVLVGYGFVAGAIGVFLTRRRDIS